MVIFSVVRSPTAGKSIGFVADERRMNVGLTRARATLVVVGSARPLMRARHWGALVADAKERGRYVTAFRPFSGFLEAMQSADPANLFASGAQLSAEEAAEEAAEAEAAAAALAAEEEEDFVPGARNPRDWAPGCARARGEGISSRENLACAARPHSAAPAAFYFAGAEPHVLAADADLSGDQAGAAAAQAAAAGEEVVGPAAADWGGGGGRKRRTAKGSGGGAGGGGGAEEDGGGEGSKKKKTRR